jgi:hypothetical protein
MVGRETDGRWITIAFLVVLAIAAFTAHAGALTISSSDTVEVSTKDSKDATTWEKMQAGDVASVTLAKPTTIKLTVTGAMENDKVEPVVQVWPSTSKVVVKPNYAGSEVDVVLVGTDRIEGYYSYGKSATYPWGFYWCIHDINGKPFVVYSEFSGRRVWYNFIGQKSVDELTATLEKGELPDISIIQAAVGA